MDIQQLEEMIKRRGYSLRVRTDKVMGSASLDHQWFDVTYLDILRGDTFVLSTNTAVFGVYESLDSWVTIIDVYCGKNQHHMQCQCGLPVLRETITCELTPEEYSVKDSTIIFSAPPQKGPLNLEYTATWVEEDRMHIHVTSVKTTGYAYRLVSAGPESEPVTTCPQCGGELATSVREIDDEK